jgi:hypothetical protein
MKTLRPGPSPARTMKAHQLLLALALVCATGVTLAGQHKKHRSDGRQGPGVPSVRIHGETGSNA